MLVGEPPRDSSWKYEHIAGGQCYASAARSVTVLEKPWHIQFRDASGAPVARVERFQVPESGRQLVRCRTPGVSHGRWLPFGMLTSHGRCHGMLPKEPWEFGTALQEDIRRAHESMPRVFGRRARGEKLKPAI